MFCCFGLFSASYLARCGAQLSTPWSLLLLCRPVPNFMEVLCLNGKSVTVDPAEGLQEAKIQVAKVLGTLPDAVSISCGGQILSELERLNSKAEFDALDAPLFAMVDQERLEVAKHLAKFEEELVVFQRQLVERQEIKETYEEKKRELHMDWCGDVLAVENRLKEGNLTPREEADLVSRLGRLDRLDVMRFCSWRPELLRTYGRLVQEVDWGRERLYRALKEQRSDRLAERMDEFDVKTADVPSYESLADLLDWEPQDGFQEERKKWRHLFKTADSLREPLEYLCPRLLRREIWSKSKRSWKFVRNETPQQGRSPRKGARAKARSRQMIRQDGRSQVQEYSFD